MYKVFGVMERRREDLIEEEENDVGKGLGRFVRICR